MDRLIKSDGDMVWVLHNGVWCEPHELAVAHDGTHTIAELMHQLAAYVDSGLTPDEFRESCDFVLALNKKLKPYMDADEQGRLVVLPCKAGDTVWIVSTSFIPCIVTATVEWISAQSQQENGFNIEIYARAEDGVGWALTDYNIGKTVFFTREEAETALNKTEI